MKPLLFIAAFLFLLHGGSLAQDSSAIFHIKDIPAGGVLLNKGWKFKAGDNPAYAQPGFDDKTWEPIDPTKDLHDIPPLWKNNIVWFRLHFKVDSSLGKEALSALVEQTGASEIYLNGRLIQRYGKFSKEPHRIKAAIVPWNEFIGLQPSSTTEQVLAVRFAVQKHLPYIVFVSRPNVAFSLRVMTVRQVSHYLQGNINLFLDFFRAGIFLLLAILHLALFWFYPAQKANLHFFIYAFINSIAFFLIAFVYTQVHLAAWKMYILIFIVYAILLAGLFFLSAVYLIFEHRRGIIFWLLAGGCLLSDVVLFLNYHTGSNLGLIYVNVLITLDAIRVTFLGARLKKRGAHIVIAGSVCSLFFFILLNLMITFNVLSTGPNGIYGHLTYNLSVLSLPVAISIYLALEASFTSRALKERLREVQQLSEKTLVQELEKQQILATQKERLEQEVTQRTAELKHSLEELKSTQAQLVQREKMASLGELTAGIAHEIQNPLNFVNNFSEVSSELIDELQNGPLQKLPEADKKDADEIANALTDNLQKIAHHGRRADAIVKNMLEHSRINTGQKELTDINVLAEEYLRLSYHGMRVKDKTFIAIIKTHFDATIEKVNVVPSDIGRVLLNIYNNAFWSVMEKKKRQPEGYEQMISVSTKRLNNGVEIRVQDNGIGIPPKVVDKIFQPFFTTKPSGEGTGLGLSLSYDIIKANGGELRVESAEGQYTMFTLTLPL